MEENKFQINEKLYSFEGIIGRHSYFVNVVIICALSTLIFLPYTTYLYAHVGSIEEFFHLSKIFEKAPLLLKLWVFLGSICTSTLSVSNIFRRLNDIFGEVKIAQSFLLCSISVLGSFYFLFPFFQSVLVILSSFVLGIVLLLKKGKITGTLPYDYRKAFNWGAFFGTWIWGLFNKSYIPLFQLLLWFTPLGFYFQLFCGLKGNEWAFKNKNCTDVREFNKSQETQTIIFTVLSLVIFPILYILLLIVLFFVIALIGGNFNNQSLSVTNSSPQKVSILDNIMDGIVSLYYESYEITEEENKFYVMDSDWNSSDFKDKKDMLDFAASKSADIKRKNFNAQNQNDYEHFSKVSELPKTKIYSAVSGKLLGEFVMNEDDIDGSFKNYFKAALKAYRFYNAD